MNSDALDDLARQLAAASASRRAALKAMAAAVVAGPIFGLPGRSPTLGLPAARAIPASSIAGCDYKAGAKACGALEVAIAKCYNKCFSKGFINWIPCTFCRAGLQKLADACHAALNCHCADGTPVCMSENFEAPECCDPSSETCDPNNGCVPLCQSQKCQKRAWYNGQCISTCTGSQTCCNGACCGPAPNTCCGNPVSGATSCVDTDTDNNNCGTCGQVCPTGEQCVQGACGCGEQTCAVGAVCCDNRCVNLQTDPNNCGSCGQACGTGSTCINGTCACQPGLVQCGPICVMPDYICCSADRAPYACPPDMPICCPFNFSLSCVAVGQHCPN
jgi:hypothetical protein